MREKSNKLACLLLLFSSIFLGFLISSKGDLYLLETIPSKERSCSIYIKLFFLILKRNLIVGVILAFVGYLTAGIITALVLIWNGVVLGATISAVKVTIPIIIQYFLIHGCIEIYAFMCFGAIGINGFDFYKKILKNGIVQFNIGFKKLIFPCVLLIVSGLIEAFLITYM